MSKKIKLRKAKQARAWWVGSYPQQHYGESLDKGYLIWNIYSKDMHKVDFIKLPNVYPYYTIVVDDDLDIAKNGAIQTQSRIRILSRRLTNFEKKQVTDKIQLFYDPIRIDIVDDINASRQTIAIDNIGNTIEDLHDIGVQEKLISEYFKDSDLSQEMLFSIFDINKKYNSLFQSGEDIARNVIYSFGLMTWNNTFSFGTNNEFDFSKHKGSVGVFGKSASGKSSFVVDNPLYIMWNKISKKVAKNDLIINDNCDFCDGSLEINLCDKTYNIFRKTSIYSKSGKRNGAPVLQGKTEVTVCCKTKEGAVIPVEGEERTVIDNYIRCIFGIAEDFMLTAIAPQWQLLNFIDSGATDRQKLVGKYFDIDFFFKKHDFAKSDLKEITGKIKKFKDKNFDILIQQSEDCIVQLNDKLGIKNKCQQETSDLLSKFRQQMFALKSSISDIDVLFPAVPLEDQIRVTTKSTEEEQHCLQRYKRDFEDIQAQIKKDEESFKLEELNNLSEKYTLLNSEMQISYGKLQALNKLNVNISEVTESLKRMLKYECLNYSSCCMLKEHDRHKSNLKNLETQREELLPEAEKYHELVKLVSTVKTQIASLRDIQQNIFNKKQKITVYEKKISESYNIIKQFNDKIESLTKLLQMKSKYVSQHQELESIVSSINALELSAKDVSKEVLSLTKLLGSEEQILKNLASEKKEFLDTKQEYEAYEYFMRAMSKDGIVKKIISKNLDIINIEINKVLSKSVDFSVNLISTDDGKAIDIVFQYKNGKQRPIELCSGMEKTFSAISIRAALLSVTTLPRPNFIVLDESFGALDSECVGSVQKMLDYLKTLFDTVMIITHDETLKDLVDYVVDVEKEDGGFSTIRSFN